MGGWPRGCMLGYRFVFKNVQASAGRLRSITFKQASFVGAQAVALSNWLMPSSQLHRLDKPCHP